MSSIVIETENLYGKDLPLYHQAAGQPTPRPAYVSLDEHGIVRAGYEDDQQHAVCDVRRGRTLKWAVSALILGADLAELLTSSEVVALFEQVHEGHHLEWQDGARVGVLNTLAKRAAEALGSLLRPESGRYTPGNAWSTQEWLAQQGMTLQALVQAGSVAEVDRLMQPELVHQEVTLTDDLRVGIALSAACSIERDMDAGAIETLHAQAAQILVEFSLSTPVEISPLWPE